MKVLHYKHIMSRSSEDYHVMIGVVFDSKLEFESFSAWMSDNAPSSDATYLDTGGGWIHIRHPDDEMIFKLVYQ